MKENRIQSYLDDVVAGRTELVLPIENDMGEIVGQMRPLTFQNLDSLEILQKLTNWRNDNKSRFLTEFEATPERTRQWLANIVFKTPGQMLFLIYEGSQLIGHLGFKGLTDEDGVLDNAIKGEKTVEPKLFVFAHKALAQWLFAFAKVSHLWGYVLTDNVAAIMMNRQIGWMDWVLCPLLKAEKNGEITWHVGSAGEVSPDNKYCFKIMLTPSRSNL